MSENIEVTITLTPTDLALVDRILNDQSWHYESNARYLSRLVKDAIPEPILPVKGLRYRMTPQGDLREVIAVDGDVVVAQNHSCHDELYKASYDILVNVLNRPGVEVYS